MSEILKNKKIIIGYGQLEALRSLSSGEFSSEVLVRKLQGAGWYASKQTAKEGIDVFIKAKIIETRENSDVIKLTPLGKRFLEGLEALFGGLGS